MAATLLQIAQRVHEIRIRVDDARTTVQQGANTARSRTTRLSELLRRLGRRPQLGRRPDELLARLSDTARRLTVLSQRLLALGYELDILLHHLVVVTTPTGRAEPGQQGDALPKPLFVEEAARRLPVRPETGGKTHGLAFNKYGLPIGDDIIESGYNGPARDAAGIDPQNRKLFGANFARTHVEAHLSAIMRQQREHKDTTLVINNGPDDDVLGCQSNLEDIMPRGSTIAVYVRDRNGLRYWGKFTGNGKAVLDE